MKKQKSNNFSTAIIGCVLIIMFSGILFLFFKFNLVSSASVKNYSKSDALHIMQEQSGETSESPPVPSPSPLPAESENTDDVSNIEIYNGYSVPEHFATEFFASDTIWDIRVNAPDYIFQSELEEYKINIQDRINDALSYIGSHTLYPSGLVSVTVFEEPHEILGITNIIVSEVYSYYIDNDGIPHIDSFTLIIFDVYIEETGELFENNLCFASRSGSYYYNYNEVYWPDELLSLLSLRDTLRALADGYEPSKYTQYYPEYYEFTF